MNLRPRAMLLALLTVLVAVMGDWSSNATLASLWQLPAGLLLLGLAYESLIVARAGVSVECSVASPWYLGRANQLQMSFAQRLRRRLRLQFAPDAPLPFSLDPAVRDLDVPAAASASINIALTPRSLGSYPWPAQRIRVVGPLGLAAWSRRLAVEFKARISPDLLRATPQTPGLGALGERASLRRGSGAELLQLRGYQPGDPPRVIDWKASARTRRLISRDFVEDQHLEVIVAIDAGRSSSLGAGALDRFGHYINAAARLAQHVVTHDDLIGLVVFADRPLIALPPARGTRAVQRLRESLAQARVTAVESSPVQAALRVRSLVRQRCLVVMLTDLDDADAAGQLTSAVHLLLPKHLPFIAGMTSPAAEALAHARARQWLDPYESLAAQEYCSGLARKVQALRTLGAPALVARPEQLDGAVLEAYGNFRQRRRV